ncbi:MAG TPA: preprotein translocase subunit SecG [Gaiellales bacterium]
MSSHLLSQILSGFQVLLGVGLVVLVLMHSGKDSGLSGMFNPGGQSYGGTAVMERNLTRLTIFVAIVFTANVIALGFLL